MTQASGLLEGPAYFIHWGVVQISLANLIVILLMIAIFVLALLLPFPHGRDSGPADGATTSQASSQPRSDHDDHS